MNSWCGTVLRPTDFSVRRPLSVPGLTGPRAGAALRGAWFQRFCRQVAGDYDVLVSAYNPCDFGRPAIHFVADFSWHHGLRAELDPPPARHARRIHAEGPLRSAYLALAGAFGHPSGRDVLAGDDLLVVNSEWTARMMGERLGTRNLEVVHPPVQMTAPDRPFQAREPGFVCLGRVSYEKRIEVMIEILRRVRERGHDLRLHIVGAIDPADPYGRWIRALVDAHPWVHAPGALTGPEKAAFLAGRRYAIHGRPGEAFGIAVAEMAQAGCIPFVPEDGGPAEIVADARLRYSDVGDAVLKICRVLDDDETGRRLSEEVRRSAARFSVARFMAAFLRVVEGFDDRPSTAVA
jgi:glycosyltransferase involved in cell wall biosynthesis